MFSLWNIIYNAIVNLFIAVLLFRRVVVILDMEVVKSADEVAGKIGEPTPYVEGESSSHTPSPYHKA